MKTTALPLNEAVLKRAGARFFADAQNDKAYFTQKPCLLCHPAPLLTPGEGSYMYLRQSL